MKHQATVHIYMKHWWNTDFSQKEWQPQIYGNDQMADSTTVYIGSQIVTIEVPDDFDPVPSQVAALNAEKAALVAEHAKKLADVNELLQNLLAITNEVEA